MHANKKARDKLNLNINRLLKPEIISQKKKSIKTGVTTRNMIPTIFEQKKNRNENETI